MLKIEQLDVKERSGRYLLKDISMEIPAGRVIGLTGKSGSGKTTLLRSILGMLHTSCHIDAGKILLDDIDLSHLSRKSHREICGKKEEITKGLTYGYETPATSLFAPGAPYTDITYNSTWSYDLDKANALLDEAGWVMNESTGIREKDGQQLSLNYTYWTDLSLAQDMALAIKTQLAEVGIDVTTTGQDQMTWWTEGVAGNYDITTWNTEGSYTEPHKFLQESLGADPHAISLQALEDFQSYSDAVNAFSTSADPEVVQSAIATALNVSNDNVIDLPISYSKDLVVYNSSKIAGYTFSSVPQFFEIDNVQPAE